MIFNYDIIVIGGGHAGCEAAYTASKMGAKTLLVTMDMTKMAQMSCNPAMGGIAKGQIIREIDALGGMTGIVTDSSMIQYRMLNRSKGPAMWSPRAQCDRQKFSRDWRQILEKTVNLHLWQEMVTRLIFEGNSVKGVETAMGNRFYSGAVILTSGTFLNGLIHVGFNQVRGGRSGEPASTGLSEQLKEKGIRVERMKTGTSARLDGRTIDFSVMEEQRGDKEGRTFSYIAERKPFKNQLSCYITQTSEEVHEELHKGLEFSPLFTGKIEGIGPRYCPSIEDKIVTFSGKTSHQLFIEPEGWDTVEYYINGFSSSLPLDVQLTAMRKIKGLEKVEIFRPGYAIEYDFFQPTQVKHTLESKIIKHLYFAGQVNGTTGYEEAAAQGQIAGINAVLQLGSRKEFIMGRDESYIGVLIDDLVTKGVDEPYRMFTARAEFRILLRQDNADERLTNKGYNFGLASAERMKIYSTKQNYIRSLLDYLRSISVEPEVINSYLNRIGTTPITQKVKAANIATRPQINLKPLLNLLLSHYGGFDWNLHDKGTIVNRDEIIESAEINLKYEGYIHREKQIAEKIARLERLKIPADIDYWELTSISTEARQKLSRLQPRSIGQAGRISGVSPADINVLLMYLGR